MPKKAFDISKEKKKKAMLKALAKHNGIIYKAAKEVGCSRQLFWVYGNEDEEFRKEAKEITEIQIDKVEERLLGRIEEGSDKLIEFYMATKGKHRGYKKTQDIEVQEKKKVIVIKRASDENDS